MPTDSYEFAGAGEGQGGGAGSLMGIGWQWSADELQAFESLLSFLKCLSDVLRETKGMLPYVCFCLVASYEQNWQEKNIYLCGRPIC